MTPSQDKKEEEVRRETWRPFRKAKPVVQRGSDTSPERTVLADVHGGAEPHSEFATDWDDLSGLQVLAAEFATTTSEGSTEPALEPIARLLQKVRERVGMDVVFISQFIDGRRVVRHVAGDVRDTHVPAPGDSDPLEVTYCQRVVDGRLPPVLADAQAHPDAARLPGTRALHVRAHVAEPIRTSDGRVHGTVCAFAHQPRLDAKQVLPVLREVARALGRALDRIESIPDRRT
jgi:GAF domain-containing protein